MCLALLKKKKYPLKNIRSDYPGKGPKLNLNGYMLSQFNSCQTSSMYQWTDKTKLSHAHTPTHVAVKRFSPLALLVQVKVITVFHQINMYSILHSWLINTRTHLDSFLKHTCGQCVSADLLTDQHTSAQIKPGAAVYTQNTKLTDT